MPTLTKNFADIISFARATTGWRTTSAGVLVPEAAGVPRIDYDPTTLAVRGLMLETEQRTNYIRNNTMLGAVAGSPGAMPTNWLATASTNGITRTVVGTGVEDGIPYVDVRFSGSPITGGQYVDVTFENPGVSATAGQTWALSVFLRLVAGSLSGVNAPSLIAYAAPAFADNLTVSIASVSSAPLRTQRFLGIRTFTDATMTNISPRVGFTVAAGATVDFTIRVGAPQLEPGALPSAPILTGGAQVTRVADVAQITLPYACDVLVQDRAGAEWRSGLSAGTYTLTPRAGFNYVSRIRAYPAGSLDSAMKAAMAVAA